MFNEWTIRGGFLLAGAHLGLPGLGAIAGAALRHGQAFASETLSIVLNPDETPERARVRIENELAAQGIAADDASWLFDEQTGELSFTLPADQAEAASGILGGIESFIEDIEWGIW